MPGERHGYELIREIRSTNAARIAAVPAAAVTACVRDDGAAEARFDAGFQMHLAKPVHSGGAGAGGGGAGAAATSVTRLAPPDRSAGSATSSRLLKNSANSTSTAAAPAAGTSQMLVPGVPAVEAERVDDAAGHPRSDEHADAERDERDEAPAPPRAGRAAPRRSDVDLPGHEEEVVADAVQQDAAVEHPHQRCRCCRRRSSA